MNNAKKRFPTLIDLFINIFKVKDDCVLNHSLDAAHSLDREDQNPK